MDIGAVQNNQTPSSRGFAEKRGRLVRVVVPLAVMYNGALAIINVPVMPLGFFAVATVYSSIANGMLFAASFPNVRIVAGLLPTRH